MLQLTIDVYLKDDIDLHKELLTLKQQEEHKEIKPIPLKPLKKSSLVDKLIYSYLAKTISKQDTIKTLRIFIEELDYSNFYDLGKSIPFLVSISPKNKELKRILEDIIITHNMKNDDIGLEVEIDKIRIDTLILLEYYFEEEIEKILKYFLENEERMIYRILYHCPFEIYSKFGKYIKEPLIHKVFTKRLKWNTKRSYLKKYFSN
jgi:hypothetical protein